MRATCINWDADEDIKPSLPTEIKIPDDINRDDITDYLSDQTGWCVYGYSLAPDAHILTAQCSLNFLPGSTRWYMYYLANRDDLLDVCRTLYAETDGDTTEKMQDAEYPCWAIFSSDRHEEGRCEGTLEQICRDWNKFLNECVQSANDQMQRAGMGPDAAFLRPAHIVKTKDPETSCTGCRWRFDSIADKCRVCRRKAVRDAGAQTGLSDCYTPEDS